MHAPRAMGLPPAVARIFERADRLEPLFAHRSHKSNRIGPLPMQMPMFPESIDLESRPPRQRGRSWDFRSGDSGEGSPGRKPTGDEHEVLESTREAELFAQSYPHPSFLEGPPVPMAMRMAPPPPMGSRSPRQQKVARSDVLAEMVYSAPVVPGLPWPRKRMAISSPRRAIDARAQALQKDGASSSGGPKRKVLSPPFTEAQKRRTHAAVTEDVLSQVIESALGHFVCDNLIGLGLDDGYDVVDPV